MNSLLQQSKSEIVVFTDLDDTLIQTRRKLPDKANTTLGATDKEGNALSFFTQSQKMMLDMFAHNGAKIIPITGRNTDALNRVQYQFEGYCSVSHGAVVLKDNDTICDNWLSEINSLLMDWPELLTRCNQEIEHIINSHNLDARTRVIIDKEIPAYISVKGNTQDLETIKQNNPLHEKFNHHENGRNHALLPPYASKKKAVEYIKKQLQLDVNDLIIGIGDSLSDLDFMSCCQFSMMPVNSQIAKELELQTVIVPKQPLTGSYASEDCQFLLKPIQAQYHSIENKELLIQSGQLHYSQMIHKESAPSKKYTDLFLQMTLQYKTRLAREIVSLASLIMQKRSGDITLLSLARAGTPIGVLVQRALTRLLKCQSRHYSISIIRDKGIDENALDYVLEQGHTPESIVFIDGWTAKGVISRELRQAVASYNHSRNVAISPELFVISDIGGTADVQATFDDYTIPSALLNSTVSGLVSRSILNDQIGYTDFHGCVQYEHLKENDLSVWFVDEIFNEMDQTNSAPIIKQSKQSRQKITKDFLQWIQTNYCVSDINRIKPGIAEATRVLLRRVPDQLLIREIGHVDTRHLERLALEKSIPVEEISDMPFGACALIKDVLK